MEIKAKLNYLRIAPRKVRSVIDLIRGKEIKQAENQLKFMPRKAGGYILVLLKSAIANAKNNFNIEKDDLYIKEIRANEGVPFRRGRAVSRGRSAPILKRTSHIILTLATRKDVKIPAATRRDTEVFSEKQAGPPQSEGLGGEKKSIIAEKPKYKAPREIKKGKGFVGSITKKIFRRKSV